MYLEQSWRHLQEIHWQGIPVSRWAVYLAVVLALFLALRLAATFGRRRLRQLPDGKRVGFTDYLARMLERTRALGLLALAALLGLWFVDLQAPEITGAEHTIRVLALVILFLQAGAWAGGALDAALLRGFRYADFSETAARTAFGVVKTFALFGIWLIVGTLVLNAFGVAITPFLAGLGIGGIAVAFALQQILGDIFCSVAIVLDRPFEVGDFIISGEHMGTVEHIGVKTTHVRSLGGEQIIFPNSDLIGSRIRNYKRMAERRVVFSFGVVYATPADVLEQIPPAVRRIIEGIDQTRFDRAHLASFGDSALNFEAVYYVLSPDYNLYMDIQQRINIAIIRTLNDLGADFALPVRTLSFAPDSAPLLAEIQSSSGPRRGDLA